MKGQATGTQRDGPLAISIARTGGNRAESLSRHWSVAVVVGVTLIPVALWIWLAIAMRDNTLAVTMADERRVTEALGVHTLKLLEAQTFVLGLLDHEAEERECPDLRSDARTRDFMRSVAQSPETQGVWIINANGFICMANDPKWIDDRSRAFRGYFAGAREAPPGSYYVDRAIVGLIDSIPAFTVAKARRKDGAFNGVLVASVSTADLTDYWKKLIDNRSTQRMALFRADGATIARSWPPFEPAPDPAAEALIATAWQAEPDGSSTFDSPIDGAHRVGAWHSLPDWGVVVTSSVDKDAALAPWRRATLINGCVAAVVSGLLGTLTWFLLRGRRLLELTVEERTSALRESKERFRGLVNASANVLYSMSADWFEMRRLDGGGLLPKTARPRTTWLADYIHAEDQPHVLEAIQTAIRTKGVFDLEHRVRKADGTLGWTHSRAIPILDPRGEICEWFGAASDVTVRRRAEEALRESEARYRAAVQALSGIPWTTNAEGEMAGEQPGWAALTGQSQEEYQRNGWVNAVHPGDAQPTIECWNAAVAKRKPFVFEHRVRRHDGVWRCFAIRAIPVLRDDGTVLQWVGVHTDVTEQREAEAELADLNHRLEERVRTEVAAREDAQARAVHGQRMQALGQLAGGIAHDFNNILQAVQGAAALIERRATDAASTKRFARVVVEMAERGAGITRRLLAFARRDELQAARIEPARLLEGLQDVLAQALGSPIKLHIEAGSGLPALMADRGQLEIVVVNLATNARDAMPDGGTVSFVAAEEEVAPGAVHPARLKPGHYIRLAVTDTGTGMDRATLERAPEPFFTTKPQDKGTGLGLSMAKGFAEQSGGALAIESALGQGTAVTLWLPVAGVSDKAAHVLIPLRAAGPSRSVLVVDDELEVLDMLAANLKDAGFSVQAVNSGALALRLLKQGDLVDALVTDLSMPDLGGLELIREAHRLRPGLPAVLLTGYAGEGVHCLAVDGAPPGVYSILRKPVSVAQLIDRIEMMITTKTRAA